MKKPRKQRSDKGKKRGPRKLKDAVTVDSSGVLQGSLEDFNQMSGLPIGQGT